MVAGFLKNFMHKSWLYVEQHHKSFLKSKTRHEEDLYYLSQQRVKFEDNNFQRKVSFK